MQLLHFIDLTCMGVHMWEPEEDLQESVLSFLDGGPGDWTQVSSLSQKCPYGLSHMQPTRISVFM